MRILLLGSGGREHALAVAFLKSPSCSKLFVLPGNPGIAAVAQCISGSTSDFQFVEEVCRKYSIDLVVVGPEQPLADGLVDFLHERNITVFGPTKDAARLEWSKGFAKDFMHRHGIPTAAYRRFTCSERSEAEAYLRDQSFPTVLKADGLAAGKGVVIAESFSESMNALDSIIGGWLGDGEAEIVIEEFMEGEEASVFAMSDGVRFVTLAPAQDHKRIGDGDTGKNTGGMGAYAPAPLVTELVLSKIEKEIIEPTLAGMKAEGIPFVGCLFVGLMIKDGTPRVVEFNCRFGDPETQVVTTVFRGDFALLLYSCAAGNLEKSSIENIAATSACCVVVASGGYPDSFEKDRKSVV